MMIEAAMVLKLKNTSDIFLAVLLTKLYVFTIDLTSQLFFTDEKRQSTSLLKWFLRSMGIVKR